MRARSLIAVALLAVPASASACPVAADLERSVAITFDDGITETYRQSGPAVISVVGSIDRVPVYRMQLARGVHILRFEEVENGVVVPGSGIDYAYGAPPAELPLPAPGGRWQADVTVSRAEDTGPEAQSQAYQQPVEVRIGDCAYQALPIVIAYDTAEGYLEGLNYLPDLGLAYLTWTRTGAADRVAVRALSIDRAK